MASANEILFRQLLRRARDVRFEGQSGRAATPAPYQSDATDPKRTSRGSPREPDQTAYVNGFRGAATERPLSRSVLGPQWTSFRFR